MKDKSCRTYVSLLNLRCVNSCNSVAPLWKAGEVPFKEEVEKFFEPTITLLSIYRHELKGKMYEMCESSSSNEIRSSGSSLIDRTTSNKRKHKKCLAKKS